jgi:hypothetical protein
VNCTTVRDRLAERALGALSAREAAQVDRHLAWCAACRKEAGELEAASATLAFTLAPEEPAPELRDRVAEAVREAVARRDRRASTPRRSRLTLIAALAALLAVLGTGWGAVMAGRAARSDRMAQREVIQRHSAVERFRDLINTLEFGSPEDEAAIATLIPVGLEGGGGSALTLVSPTIPDMAIVIVDGLPPAARERLPFAVRIRRGDDVLFVGRLTHDQLDDTGSGTVTGEFLDLTGFDTVIVRDADGDIVMQGTMQTRATLESPGP